MNVTGRQTDDGRIAYIYEYDNPVNVRSRSLNTQRFDFKMINTAGLGNTFIIYRREQSALGGGEHD